MIVQQEIVWCAKHWAAACVHAAAEAHCPLAHYDDEGECAMRPGAHILWERPELPLPSEEPS